jgi:hypothetical protein
MDITFKLTVARTIIAVLALAASCSIPFMIYWLKARRPRLAFEQTGNGLLVRHLVKPMFDQGWGIISLGGKLRVSHQSVTVVDAQLAYKMDPAHVRPSDKFMDEHFPPLFIFERVGNDGTIPAFPRRSFDPIKVTPGGGEQLFTLQFCLGGNFAEAYSDDFFSGKFTSLGRLSIPMLIRFQYEYNGKFYWTKDFTMPICPMSNQGWTSNGPQWIDDEAHVRHVEHGPIVYN